MIILGCDTVTDRVERNYFFVIDIKQLIKLSISITHVNKMNLPVLITFLERIDPQARDPRVQGHCEWRSCSLQPSLL